MYNYQKTSIGKTTLAIKSLAIVAALLMHFGDLNAKNFIADENPADTSEHYIGKEFGGGIIFYLDSTGQHGLIAATKDQKASATWGFFKKTVTAYGVVIGTGMQNTKLISRAGKKMKIAAVICNNLELNEYTDWYLPSSDELALLYTNLFLKNIGNFSAKYYWSSSETDFNNAWMFDFENGLAVEQNVATSGIVRAIRSF